MTRKCFHFLLSRCFSKHMRKATIGPVMSARPSISTEERLSDLTDFCEISYSGLLIKICQNHSEITDYVHSCEWETVFSVRLEQRLKQQVPYISLFTRILMKEDTFPFTCINSLKDTRTSPLMKLQIYLDICKRNTGNKSEPRWSKKQLTIWM